MRLVKHIPDYIIPHPIFKVTQKEWNKFAVWFNRNPKKNSKICGFLICEHGMFLYTTNPEKLREVVGK